MVDLKTKQVNGQVNGPVSSSPVRGFFGQAAEVTGDAIELAELQVRLAKADAANAARIATRPIVVIAACGVALLASLPVLLLAIAGFIARWSGISTELSQILVSGFAVGIAMVSTLLAVRCLGSTLNAFSRSAEEFKHNLVWLKTIFRSSKST